MKKKSTMRLNLKNIFSVLLLITIAFVFNSCEKNTETTVKIIVRDAYNSLVVGASVVIDADPDTSVDPGSININNTYRAQTTDYKGEAKFNFSDLYKPGSAGVAILDVEVQYGSSTGGQTGTGVIKIEPEVETVETIYIQ